MGRATPAALALLIALTGTAGAQNGIASVYTSHERHNKWTASGERMNDRALTVAHRTWPLGSKVLVKHGRYHVVARINDRGPYKKHRILDVTLAVANMLHLAGLGPVSVELLK
jgi:rare lipoprotein A